MSGSCDGDSIRWLLLAKIFLMMDWVFASSNILIDSRFPSLVFDVQVGEVGELSEIFQWKGEVDKGLPNWEESDKEHLAEELSDVLLYLVRLADVCGVDLGDAATRKIVKNAIKYPPKASWNSCLISCVFKPVDK